MSAPRPIEVINCAAMLWAARVPAPSTAARAVLAVLAAHCDHEGAVRLTQAEIAALACMTVRSVGTTLSGMVGRQIARQAGAGGGRGKGRQPDRIVLHFHMENFALCTHLAEIDAASKFDDVLKDPIKTSTRGVTSPSPRVRGLDNLLGLSSSEAKASSEEARPKKADSATALPDDWSMEPWMTAYCAEHSYTAHEAAFIANRFETFWRSQSGAKAKKKDWRRTFMTWVMNEKRWQVQQGAAAWKSPIGSHDIVLDGPAELEAARARLAARRMTSDLLEGLTA